MLATFSLSMGVANQFQITVAMERHRHIFVGEPDWLTLPWQTYPKMAYDRILDVLAVLPGLFEESETIFKEADVLKSKNLALRLLD